MWTQSVPDLASKLKTACENAINWFKLNKMIVNQEKFQAILLNKGKSDLTNLQMLITQ